VTSKGIVSMRYDGENISGNRGIDAPPDSANIGEANSGKVTTGQNGVI